MLKSDKRFEKKLILVTFDICYFCCSSSGLTVGTIVGIVIGCIIVLAVIVGLIAACICGCGQAKGQSGNDVDPEPGQGTYLIRSCA